MSSLPPITELHGELAWKRENRRPWGTRCIGGPRLKNRHVKWTAHFWLDYRRASACLVALFSDTKLQWHQLYPCNAWEAASSDLGRISAAADQSSSSSEPFVSSAADVLQCREQAPKAWSDILPGATRDPYL
ncbi:hypothetical protein ACLOJK_010679 [Asimina triloba]